MKVYTKTGDNGTTSLFGGTRVPKHHIRIESYGTIDELNAYLGLIRDSLNNTNHINFIIQIQNDLFTLGAQLATEKVKEQKLTIETIDKKSIERIEKEIDQLQHNLPKMTHFILPGGHTSVSICHVARCICRRAERLITALNETEPIDQNNLQYINRLSDYLFVLSRKIGQEFNIEETKWQPNKNL